MGRILISGASIAGPTVASWLADLGHEVLVVERAPQLRTGGQNIDVRGVGREVIRRMGLDEAVAARTTGEQATEFVDASGRVRAHFDAGTDDTSGATGEREILRGDLAQLLVEHSRERGVEYRFGTTITAIDSGPGAAQVSFDDGSGDDFDLVIVAEGLGSATRNLVMDDVEIVSLGLEMTYGTIPRTAADDPVWRWYAAPGRRSITTRPDQHGTTRATLGLYVGRDTPRRREDDRGRQLAWLREHFAGAGWQTDRILDGLATSDDVYWESTAQVHAPRWSTGRVVLLGDAAWCASPVSGMGTTLSLAGAYVLAGEIAAHVHHRDAFAGYERIMRPLVDAAQKLPPGTPGVAHPRSAFGVAVLNTLAALASRVKVPGGFGAPPADAIDLPDYSHLLA